MLRRLTVLVAATAAALALAVPAQADTPAVYTQVGLKIGKAVNPHNPGQWLRVAVAANLGNTDADSEKELVVGVGRANEEGNTGVARWHITLVRVRQGTRVVNDFYPSADSAANFTGDVDLNNTPPGCRFGPTPVGSDAVVDLYDAKTPPSCSDITDAARNPLHNQRDYSPDVTLTRGFSDQQPTSATTCPNVQVRVSGEARWDDGTLSAFTLVSRAGVSSDSPGCP